MASMAFSLQFTIRHSQFPSLHAFPCRTSPNLASLKAPSSVSPAPGLELLPGYRETSAPMEFSGKGWSLLRRRDFIKFPVTNAVEADGIQIEISNEIPKLNNNSSAERFPALVTGFFFLTWYFLNVIFNVLNKKLFVSVTHLLVGVAYCLIGWAAGLPKRSELWALLILLSFSHALGHIASNVSFAAVAVSFTHTVKALEPFFNAAASQFVLGQQIPLSLWLSLAPVVIAMDSTNLYAYISIMSLLISIPPALLIEGPQLMQYGFRDAIVKVGLSKFLSNLFLVGMFFHLYNQVAANTLERVTPLSHAVGNVLKRIFVIGLSIVVFGNRISTQTGIGTAIAVAGVAIYSFIKANIEEQKKEIRKGTRHERPKM